MRPKVSDLIKHRGTKCFYTGLTCVISTIEKDRDNPLRASREHLVAKSICNLHIDNNTVVAAAGINSIVGRAPLAVKFHIKKSLVNYIKNEIANYTESDEIYRSCKSRTLNILKRFKVNGSYPWEWDQFTGAKRAELFYEYSLLLTHEEKQLLRLKGIQ